MEPIQPTATDDSTEPADEAPPTPPAMTPTSEDDGATVEQLHERADADFANGSELRKAFDEHARRYGAW